MSDLPHSIPAQFRQRERQWRRGSESEFDVSEERYYQAGTREALYVLSRGYCYMPECKERVMRWTEDGWYLKAQITHIRGLNDGSARYDEKMDVPQRNNFKNLMLMCTVHHKLVDGKKTWMHYSVEQLTKWKKDREGNLDDKLDLLDWITQKKLQNMMANAIEGMLDKILGAIDSVSGTSKETLALLKSLVDQTLKLPYLDPQDIASLEYCAGVFEVLPEYVPALSDSAHKLKDIGEYIDLLHLSAHKLEDLPENVDMLHLSAMQLADLSEHAPQLLEAAEMMSGRSIWSYQDGVDQVNAAADRLASAMSSISQIDLSAGRSAAYYEPASAPSNSTAQGNPWKYFWWGACTCAVFVTAVLGFWTFVTAHHGI